MNNAFYTGVSGMMAFQQQMDITAHNMANVSTAGYKAGRSTFSDLMYTKMDVNTPGDKTTGHGVKNPGADVMMEQGSLRMTNGPLDFAIVGDGFFALDDGSQNLKYTRNGAFTVSAEGNKAYLVSGLDGSYVLDSKGKAIELQKKAGTEVYELAGLEERLGIYTVPNPYGMNRNDGSCFTVTDKSGDAKAVRNDKNAPSYEVRAMTLENSATNLGDEMLNVIQAQRAYQMNSKIVQTADQIEEMINNLR